MRHHQVGVYPGLTLGQFALWLICILAVAVLLVSKAG